MFLAPRPLYRVSGSVTEITLFFTFRLVVDSSVGRSTWQEKDHDYGVSTIWFLLFYLIYMHEQVSNPINSLPKVDKQS